MHSKYTANIVFKVWEEESKEKKNRLSKRPKPTHTFKFNYIRDLNLKIDAVGPLYTGATMARSPSQVGSWEAVG